VSVGALGPTHGLGPCTRWQRGVMKMPSVLSVCRSGYAVVSGRHATRRLCNWLCPMGRCNQSINESPTTACNHAVAQTTARSRMGGKRQQKERRKHCGSSSPHPYRQRAATAATAPSACTRAVKSTTCRGVKAERASKPSSCDVLNPLAARDRATESLLWIVGEPLELLL